MNSFYDEKGKVFTPVITKDPVRVVIQTITHRIEGTMHVSLNHRVKDELDKSESFLAITDATVYDQQGLIVLEAPFVAVYSHQIIWLVPFENAPSSGK
jgi:hypothetical protein